VAKVESEAAGAKPERPRILVLEDNFQERRALAAALERAGFHADCAGSAGEALASIEMLPRPAAALIDLKLPESGGGLVVWRIRRSYGRDVPVAVVTGVPDPLSHPDLVRDVPDKLFPKPADVAAVIDWLRSVT
jgi:CheY-like chemotaxis protein